MNIIKIILGIEAIIILLLVICWLLLDVLWVAHELEHYFMNTTYIMEQMQENY